MDWLTQRVDEAPTSYHQDLPEMAALRARMAWQKLNRRAKEGDEIWAFANPSSAAKKQGGQVGFALVRDGKVVDSVAVGKER